MGQGHASGGRHLVLSRVQQLVMPLLLGSKETIQGSCGDPFSQRVPCLAQGSRVFPFIEVESYNGWFCSYSFPLASIQQPGWQTVGGSALF